MDAIGWDKIIALPAAIIVLLAILGFFLRVLPYWKEVKLAEINVREREAESRTHEASIFGRFSESINSISSVLERIVLDQQRENENTRLLQRVTADASEKILTRLDALDEVCERATHNSSRIASLEDKCEMLEEQLIKE